MKKDFFLKTIFIASIAFLGACASIEVASKNFEMSKYSTPQELAKNAEDSLSASDACDELLWTLEAAESNKIAKNLSKAKGYYEDALSLMNDDNDDSVSLIKKGKTPFFQATVCDKILTLSNLALLSITSNNNDDALSYLKQAKFLVENSAKTKAVTLSDEVKSLKEALQGERNILSLLAKDSDFLNSLKSAYNRNPLLDDASQPGISKNLSGAYSNSLVPFLSGLAVLSGANSKEDVVLAQTFFKTALDLSPTNVFLRDDILACEQFLRTLRFPRTTYVIYESGYSPTLRLSSMPISLEIKDGEVAKIYAEKPVFVEETNYFKGLQIFALGKFYNTEVLMNVSEIEYREFSASLSARLGKTLLKCALNAEDLFKGNDNLTSYSDLTSELSRRVKVESKMLPDLRMWSTKPSLISYARFPTPDINKIIIENQEITLTTSPINIVWVRAPIAMSTSGERALPQISVFGIDGK